METTERTPGPWQFQVRASQENHMGEFIGRDGAVVCSFGDGTTFYPTEGEPPNDADIALIEAAPDLLDALKDALCALEVCGKDYGYAMGKARAAIAKATGRTG